MPRLLLEEARLHPLIRARVAGHGAEVVDEVRQAASSNAVLVVGMSGNPWCARARKTLDAAGVEHRYLEYGSYFKAWRTRLALKMWTGWPTFPMVFVRGQLVGGAQDLRQLVDTGELKRLLAGHAA